MPSTAASRRCSHGPGRPSATFRLMPQQLRARPPADAQRDPPGRPVAGVPEALGELDDAPRLGPAEGVDGLVGVADRDQVAAAAGQQLEQLDLGGVGVLVLVDEQPAGALALLAQQLRIAVELGDRLADQLGRVVARRVTAPGGGEGGDRLVLLLERGGVHPVVAAGLAAPRGELRGADPALGGPQQQLAQLGAEARRPQRRRQPRRPADGALLLGVAAQQLGDHGVLLGGGQQPRRGSPRSSAARRSTP